MLIEEQDIFNYVFSHARLSEEKIKFIESNESLKEAIDFYKQLKLNSEIITSSELKKKLAERIPAYKIADIIELYPLKQSISQAVNGNKMAAGTKDLIPRTTTKTFVDSDKDYLIKVLNCENETKVFVFSTKDKIVKNFDLIIEPQKLKYHFEDNSEPLIINQSVDAKKIQLKFI